MEKILDQYGDEVPTDLVVLNETMPSVWPERDRQRIASLDWYERDRMILVPLVKDLTDFLTSVEDYDIILSPNRTLDKIDSCLHRWNDIDGFYHA